MPIAGSSSPGLDAPSKSEAVKFDPPEQKQHSKDGRLITTIRLRPIDAPDATEHSESFVVELVQTTVKTGPKRQRRKLAETGPIDVAIASFSVIPAASAKHRAQVQLRPISGVDLPGDLQNPDALGILVRHGASFGEYRPNMTDEVILVVPASSAKASLTKLGGEVIGSRQRHESTPDRRLTDARLSISFQMGSRPSDTYWPTRRPCGDNSLSAEGSRRL